MLCPKCQAENADTAEICAPCGARLIEEGPSTVPSVLTAPPPTVNAPSPTETRTCGMAVSALVYGIVSILTFGLSIIPAIIFGILALTKINASHGQLKGKGMAITGMALAVTLVPIAATILFQTRAKAIEQSCLSNQKMLAISVQIYALDHDNQLPNDIVSLDVPSKVYLCRALSTRDSAQMTSSYGYNVNLKGAKLDTISDQSHTLVTADSNNPDAEIPTRADFAKRHSGNFIASFVDGHAEAMKTDKGLQLEIGQ